MKFLLILASILILASSFTLSDSFAKDIKPQSIATDNFGNLYVLDINGQILKFDESGEFSSKFGNFKTPLAMDLDSEGNIYVTEPVPPSLEKISPDGKSIFKIFGDEGRVNWPSDIAFNQNGDLFVVEMGNHRISKFDKTGNFITYFGGVGSSEGKFNSPEEIVIDSNDNLFISDRDNHRIQKFDSNGNYITQWKKPVLPLGENSSTKKLYDTFNGLGIDSKGNIYGVDIWNNRILKFDPMGNLLDEIQSNFDFVSDIAIDSNDNLFVSDRSNKRIVHLSPEGKYISEWSTQINDEIFGPDTLAINSEGIIYATGGSSIREFDKSGNFIKQWRNDEGYGHANSITFDKDGNVFVSAVKPNQIHKFDTKGNLLETWNKNTLEEGQFTSSAEFDIDEKNNILLAHSSGNYFHQFDSTGKFLKNIFYDYNSSYSLMAIESFSDGNLYIAYQIGIHHLNPNGEMVSSWKSPHWWGGWSLGIEDIEKNSKGQIIALSEKFRVHNDEYGTIESKPTIQKFDRNGNFISEWNLDPSIWPSKLTLDPQNNVYFSEHRSQKIPKYDEFGNLLHVIELEKLDFSENNQKENSQKDKHFSSEYVSNNYTYYDKQNEFLIPYEISNGKLDAITRDCTKGILRLSVSTESGGEIIMKTPRDFFSDEPQSNRFFIIIDAGDDLIEIFSEEEFHNFKIPFSKETSKIDFLASFTPEIGYDNTCGQIDEDYSIYSLHSPRVQLKNGVLPNDVMCKYEYELLFKTSDNSPVCIKWSSIDKLLERGFVK